MKVQDLQIGDWVYIQPWDCEPTPSRVTGIHFHSWEGKDYCDWIDTEGWDELNPKEVTPIPLSEAFFEANGYKFDGDAAMQGKHVCIFYGDEDHGWLVEIDREDLFPWGKSLAIHMSYVHEFQHALKDCGINKKIKLPKQS